MKNLKNKKKKQYIYKRNYLQMTNGGNLNIQQTENNNILLSNVKLKLNYKFDIMEEFEVNNLSYTNNINKPNKESISQFLQSLDSNEDFVFNNSFNKIIDEKTIVIRKIGGDGNCFFRSLSFFFTHSENYKDYFRNCIYNYINKNSSFFIKEFPFIFYNNQIINIYNYINNINNDCYYAGELELLASADLFKINILVLEYIEEYKGYIQRNKIERDQSSKPILFLLFNEYNKIAGHYDLIYIKSYLQKKIF